MATRVKEKSMFLSIIIPAYNEERRLGASLDGIAQFLAGKSYQSEVIVVDDGSSDGTVALVKQHIGAYEAAGLALRVIPNPGNCGKGYSVRNGMLHARGEIALFTDADLSAPISEVDQLIAPIIAGAYDVVFGSRALSPSLISTHQSFMRETAGRTFNLMMRALTGLPYKDTQCGFKAFHRLRARGVFEQQRIYGFGFDVEVLFIAKKHGLRLLEMPVVWGDVEGSKVSLMRGCLAFWDLAIIRWNEVCRRYAPIAEPSAADAISTR
jgi:glycosyltransferase involved in cell wall biosynthesis